MNRYLPVLLILILVYFPCYISDDLLARLTDEDGPYENIGALLFLFSAIVFALLAARPGFYLGKKTEGKYPERWYFLFFTLLFFISFGEEISWGQRIFNFDTPEAIKEMNAQEEFNLHNLDVFDGRTAEGNQKTGIVGLFSIHRVYFMAFFAYLLILPLLNRISPWVKSVVRRFSIPVPHLALGVLYTFNLLYGDIIRAINPTLENHGVVEIKEAGIALILFVLPLSWVNLNTWKRNKAPSK